METTNKIEWIFFDLDGTLADSINKLYSVYFKFLKDYGIKGNLKEFNEFNGPNVDEIVLKLKKKYKLKNTKKLLKNYNKKIKIEYINIKPVKGSENLLKFLKKQDYKLALVTSLNKNIAYGFLQRNDWLKYFSKIVYGNEVVNSKPNPDIYKLCLQRTKVKKNNVLVFEDSANGYESAARAGLKCIIVKNLKNIKKFNL